MIAVAMNESAKGTSSIALNKNNLFGINAVDLSSSNVNREIKEISDLNVAEIYSSSTTAYFITDAGELYKLSDISATPELVNLGI